MKLLTFLFLLYSLSSLAQVHINSDSDLDDRCKETVTAYTPSPDIVPINHTATVTIIKHGYICEVTNACGARIAVFTKTPGEWSDYSTGFIANYPACVTLCCRKTDDGGEGK